MSYMLRALLSIVVGVAAVVVMIWRATTLTDAVSGAVVAVALLVFIRAIMSLASDSGEQPPASDAAPQA